MNHAKFRMYYHLIFSVKFRRRLLDPIREDIEASFRRAETMQESWSIRNMAVDSDHVHLFIEATPQDRPSEIVHALKQTSTYDMWQKHHDYLSKFFWKEHLLWTRGYFCSTVGDVSEKTLVRYIENQG